MLELVIEGTEYYDDEAEAFVMLGGQTFYLEHSLLSVSKWEQKFAKPFLADNEKTNEEMSEYISFMLFSPGEISELMSLASNEHIEQINDYINSPNSATTFGEMPKRKGRGETITSELIYYWMVAYNIPFECESWHLNRLFSLIRICNIKAEEQNPNKPKTSRADLARQNAELNAKRLKEFNTTG